ncbi:MAG: phosphoribosylformylglycinamidine synthase subunit PurL [Actinomycetota bacterium]|nr:phosphoribosylformylglycinamidine synthase subunit PurL [Actinomycetota bacterium]
MSEVYRELGLKREEYDRIVDILGRKPNFLELAMYSVMWSEHCAYKHSKPVLTILPTQAPHVLQGPGENAGVIDIGDGLAVVFKVESHNHPSAIEPFQGAATGVGGIIRDILAMGARPIALLDSLRFGSPQKSKVKYLLEQVVAGISAYGNSTGVPTVGGEVYFEDAYEGNPLVNVMCVGLAKHNEFVKGVAKGRGNLILLIGSKTGRDGIGGVSTLASREFGEEAEEKRPSVQVGDPFTEKLLIEACLELMEKKLLVGLQDLGGAGLTCATCETASRAGMGMDVDVLKVPRRERDMKPWEVMISESQERMLAIATPKNMKKAIDICHRWGLDATVVGKVTNTGILRIFEGKDIVGQMPTRSLAHDAPIYYAQAEKPAYVDELQKYDLTRLEVPSDFNEVLLDLLSSPNICSRKWIYEQYDHMVQVNTVVLPGSDASVLRIKGTNKGLALTVDCNGRYCYLDPFIGAKIAVAEAARNLVCSGAKSLAVSDCLNFGSPEKPEIFWQFREAVRGLSEACTELGIPVVSGNVSFYNESFGEAIYPTPTVGMVGILEDISHRCTLSFKEEDSVIALLGITLPELGGSEYLKVVHNLVAGSPPILDMGREIGVQRLCLKAIQEELILSAHDCSEGGLAVTLAECCITGGLGAMVRIQDTGYRIQENPKSPNSQLPSPNLLFSESQSRIIVSLREENLPKLEKLAREFRVPVTILGRVGGNALVIDDKINLQVSNLARRWQEALECLVKL